MNVLIACEFSGIVREAFKNKGHNAFSCDLIDTEIPGQHLKRNVLDVIEANPNFFDLMIAHPPCKYLTNASAVHYFGKKAKNVDQRIQKGLEAKEFFMKLFKANIPKKAIENPYPLKMFNLPKPTQIIQPYEFGHPFQKRTCLWLVNLPKLQPTEIVNIRQSTKIPGNWFNKGGKERQKNRSKTFSGIAHAMAEQWG